MKSFNVFILSFLLFTAIGTSYAKEEVKTAVQTPPPVRDRQPSRVEQLQAELKALQDDYQKVVAMKYDYEINMAVTSGKLQEAIENQKVQK